MDFMDLADITPDAVILWRMGWIKLNLTIVFTWITMCFLLVISWLATRRLQSGKDLSPWQNFLEAVIEITSNQIEDISQQRAGKYLDFIGALFLFIVVSNLFMVVPGYVPPTGSLATTSALALCVFIAAPGYGIVTEGLVQYLKLYSSPTLFMLPFNLVSEFTRTLAMAVRLFGNVMSASKIAAILLAVIPLVFPVLMHLLGLLTGFIQAYIFAVLAMVYITSATRVQYELEKG